MIQTIQAVVAKSGAAKEEIKGIGISGQMHGLVMLDKDNQVLRNSIIWCDQRTAAEVDEMNRTAGQEKLMEITANPALTGWTAAKILWVRNNEPEVYEKCRHILLPKDYLRLILTGEYATEVSDASGMQLLDVAHRCWSDELLHLLQIDKSLLGKVYESCEVTGTLTRDMAETLGLCEERLLSAVPAIMQLLPWEPVSSGTARHSPPSAPLAWSLHTLLPWQWTARAESTPAVQLSPTAGTSWA